MKDTTGNIKVFIISKLSLENRAVRWGRDPEQRQGGAVPGGSEGPALGGT